MNQQILKHLSEGDTIKEIAGKVFLSKAAVEKRIRKMKSAASTDSQAEIKNNVELVLHAHKNNLLTAN